MIAVLLGLLAGCVALGCSGGQANLGDNREHWFEGNAMDPAATSVPTTIFDGQLATYDVDESTLYVSFIHTESSLQTTYWKSCDLANCAATVRPLYQSSTVLSGPPREPLLVPVLAVGGSEIFFTSSDSAGEPGIFACPRTGCRNAPRELVPTRDVRHMLVTNDHVFWDDGQGILRCARAGCAGPERRPFDILKPAPDFEKPLVGFTVAGQHVYVAGAFAVARIELDLLADPEWIYMSEVPIRGVAIIGSWLYMGISTLAGELRRCPITGCTGDPEIVVSAQRWPSAVLADEHRLYWFDAPGGTSAPLPSNLFALATDGSSAPKTLASKITHRHEGPFLMNSHHLYWADFASGGSVRTIAK